MVHICFWGVAQVPERTNGGMPTTAGRGRPGRVLATVANCNVTLTWQDAGVSSVRSLPLVRRPQHVQVLKLRGSLEQKTQVAVILNPPVTEAHRSRLE